MYTFTSSNLSRRQSKNSREALFRATSKEHSRRSHGNASTQRSQYSQFKSVNRFAKKNTCYRLKAAGKRASTSLFLEGTVRIESKVFSQQLIRLIMDYSFQLSRCINQWQFQNLPIPAKPCNSVTFAGDPPWLWAPLRQGAALEP